MTMNVAAKIALGVAGTAAVGAGTYLAVNALRNKEEGVDAMANKYLTKFDSNNDSAINLEFESEIRERRQGSNSYVDPNGYTQTSYYNYVQTDSMKALAQRADAKPGGDGNGTASFEEMVRVIRTYDKGDGTKHAAGDNVLGGAERRDFNKAYGVKSTTD